MITIKNYLEQTAKMDLSNISDIEKELHDFTIVNIDVYGHDQDIDDIIEKSVSQMNKILEKQRGDKQSAQKKALEEKNKNTVLASDISGSLKVLMPKHQQKIVVGNPEMKKILKELEADLNKIPSYSDFINAENSRNEMVYAHYFYSGSDWFVMAKSGEYLNVYAILNGDAEMSEMGFEAIESFVENGKVELDFYWTPKTLAEALYSVDSEYFENPKAKKIPTSVQKTADHLMQIDSEIWIKNDWGSRSSVDLDVYQKELFAKLNAEKTKLPVSKQVLKVIEQENHNLLIEYLSKPIPKSKVAKQTKATKPEKAVKTKAVKPKAETKTPIDVVPVEVTYISTFLKLENTTQSYAEIQKRLGKMQADIYLKKIRKTSKYAKQIEKVQDSYNHLIKSMNDSNSKSAKIEFSEETKKMLLANLDVTTSQEVKVIKRFYSLYNVYKNAKIKDIPKRVEALSNDIEKLITAKKISKTSKHFSEIQAIQKHLKAYLKTSKMEISETVLNGLNAIMQTDYSIEKKKDNLSSDYSYQLNQNIMPQVLKKSNVDKVFDDMKTLVDMVIDGKQPALIISGSAGIGKTFVVRERLKEKRANYEYIKGRSTAAALYVALYENNGKTIVFDDCDSVIKSGSEEAINILKAVLDSYDQRNVSWLALKKPILDQFGKPIPSKFEFTGNVIFLTNIPLSEIKEALVSRSFVTELILSTDDIIYKMKQVLPKLDTKAPIYLREKALETIIQLHRSGVDIDLNMRTLLKAIRIMESVKDVEAAKRMIETQCKSIN